MSRGVRALVACGIAAPLIYLSADVVASLSYDGYHWADQAVSELFAVEAPTRDFVVAMFTIYNALLFAFSIGIWRSADGRRALQVIALLLAASSVLGLITDFFAPMHARGFDQGASGQWHIILTGVQTLFIFAMLAVGTRTLERWFRIVSWAVIAILLVAGPVSGLLTGDMETSEPSPWLGVAERVLIYTYLLWTGLLAASLLREDQPA